MLLMYSETGSSSLSLLEVDKVDCFSVVDKETNKNQWVICFLSTGIFQRIEVYVENFQKGMELVNKMYQDGKLDISSEMAVYVQAQYVYEQLMSDDGEEDYDDIDGIGYDAFLNLFGKDNDDEDDE